MHTFKVPGLPESIKLARQLGYNPIRNIASSGLMKVVSISTSEPLTDSLGNDLVSRTINWNDANNSDSYEQFITILNSAFGNVNRFSKPVKTFLTGQDSSTHLTPILRHMHILTIHQHCHVE